MSEHPRRRRFQIHLSTAVVMMFVADGLIWANVRTNNWQHLAQIELEAQDERRRTVEYLSGSPTFHQMMYGPDHGWPRTAYRSPHSHSIRQDGWDFMSAAIDLIVAITILLATWFLCEWQIRRAARKGA
jgi:hypothetical protein